MGTGKLLAIYFSIFIGFSLTYVLLFHSPLFRGVEVLFYRGVILLALTGILFLAVFIFLKNKINGETFLAALIMSLSLNLAFFIVFPVTFDRSVTMFLLNTLKQEKSLDCTKGLSKNKLQRYLIDDYVVKDDAVGRRIKEQAAIEMIKRNGNCINLTSKANRFLRFAQIVRKIYGIK